jgi:uncharacterized protein
MSMLLPIAAGLVAGTMNAVAGGGSFVSLPALLAAGLPSVAANQTSTVALFPGQVTSLLAMRNGIDPAVGGVSIRVLLPISLVGGLVGAVLLMVTPSAMLDQVLPWLLLLAVVAFGWGRQFSNWLRDHGVRIGTGPVLAAQVLLAVYGGYFGGAVGIMMMAVWFLLESFDLRRLTASRILLAGASNAVAVLAFAALGDVRWPQAIGMAAGSGLGGWGGAHIAKRLPSDRLRQVVLVITISMTAWLFWRLWGR